MYWYNRQVEGQKQRCLTHPRTFAFAEDLRDRSIQCLQGHQTLGSVIQAGLVVLKITFLQKTKTDEHEGERKGKNIHPR